MARLLEEQRYHLPLLFVFLLLVNLPFLGSRDLWAPVEPRYGEIARVMFARDEWIVPTVNGRVYTDKPILFFWFVLLAARVQSAVTEWAVRFPSAVSACAVALLTYGIGKKYFSAPVGFLAALICATSARVIWEARWAHTDMLFTAFFVASLHFLFRIWLEQAGRAVVALAYVFMGLATLTKGLIGFVIPGLWFLALVLWTRDWKKLRALRLPFGAAVFLTVTAPWFAAVGWRTDGEWLKDFVWRHHIQRYVAGEGHEEPFYYYLVNFPLDFLPWSFFLALAVWALWQKRKSLAEPPALFLAAWFAVVFLFFSASNTKRGLYLLPLFPPAALFTACYVYWAEKGVVCGAKALKIVAAAIAGALIVAGIAVPWVGGRLAPGEAWRFLPLAIVMAGAGALTVLWARKGSFGASAVALACAMGLSMVSVQGSIVPIIDRHKSPRVFAAEIEKHVAPGAPLYIYRDSMNDFNFYLAREEMPILSRPEEVVELGRERPGAYLLARERRLVERVANSRPSWRVLARGKVGGKEWVLLRAEGEKDAPLR